MVDFNRLDKSISIQSFQLRSENTLHREEIFFQGIEIVKDSNRSTRVLKKESKRSGYHSLKTNQSSKYLQELTYPIHVVIEFFINFYLLFTFTYKSHSGIRNFILRYYKYISDANTSSVLEDTLTDYKIRKRRVDLTKIESRREVLVDLNHGHCIPTQSSMSLHNIVRFPSSNRRCTVVDVQRFSIFLRLIRFGRTESFLRSVINIWTIRP